MAILPEGAEGLARTWARAGLAHITITPTNQRTPSGHPGGAERTQAGLPSAPGPHKARIFMGERTDILIIGAGPTGLAAALFLSERGLKPRIIERAWTRSLFSKAFAVNARSLDLLQPSGVTELFLENGRRTQRLRLRRPTRVFATLNLAHVDNRYPFMCIQSQADSERILAEAVSARGIDVERGVEARSISIDNDVALITLEGPNGNETLQAATVLGAAGAGSMVRKSLGVSFEGTSYPEPWRFWDIELEVPLDPDDGHMFILDGGGMFVVRHTADIWRVLGTGPNLLESAGVPSTGYQSGQGPLGIRVPDCQPGGREVLAGTSPSGWRRRPHPRRHRCAGHESRPGRRVGLCQAPPRTGDAALRQPAACGR